MKPPTQRETLNFDISRLTKNTSMGSLLARAKQNQIMQKQLSTARNAKKMQSFRNIVKPPIFVSAGIVCLANKKYAGGKRLCWLL